MSQQPANQNRLMTASHHVATPMPGAQQLVSPAGHPTDQSQMALLSPLRQTESPQTAAIAVGQQMMQPPRPPHHQQSLPRQPTPNMTNHQVAGAAVNRPGPLNQHGMYFAASPSSSPPAPLPSPHQLLPTRSSLPNHHQVLTTSSSPPLLHHQAVTSSLPPPHFLLTNSHYLFTTSLSPSPHLPLPSH